MHESNNIPGPGTRAGMDPTRKKLETICHFTEGYTLDDFLTGTSSLLESLLVLKANMHEAVTNSHLVARFHSMQAVNR